MGGIKGPHATNSPDERVRSSARARARAQLASVHPWRFNEARSFSPLRRDKEFLLASFAGVTGLTGIGKTNCGTAKK